MVLPFEPHSITFDEIRYAVDMPQVPFEFQIEAQYSAYTLQKIIRWNFERMNETKTKSKNYNRYMRKFIDQAEK